MNVLIRALLAAIAGSLLIAVAPTTAYAVDHDCSDFSTQQQAQEYFLAHDPRNDPERLDSDGDLIACESNPCPCSTSTTPITSGSAGVIRQRGRVTHIVDGDTVDVHLSTGGTKRIRMLGIDTPEEYGTVECGAHQAARMLEKLIPVGTRVRLVSDSSQARVDRYGRLLRYVERARDGRDIDRAQVFLGMSKVYVYGNTPFQRVRPYRSAQADARAHNRGLWRTCW